MKKNIILILMFAIFLCMSAVVSAAPPFIAETTQPEAGLIVIHPLNFYFPANTSFKMNYDILNSTYAKMDNSTTSCSFDMVNITGDNIESGSLTYDSVNDYWYYSISGIPVGTYSYYIHCSGASESGYLSERIIATSNGEDNESIARAIAMVIMGLIPLFIAALLFWVYYALAEQQFPLKIFTLLLGFVFILIEYNVVYEISYFFNITFIYSTMQHWLFSWCFYIILLYIGIMLIYNLFMGLHRGLMHKKNKDFEELMP